MATVVAGEILVKAVKAKEQKKYFNLALSGGNTPKILFRTAGIGVSRFNAMGIH